MHDEMMGLLTVAKAVRSDLAMLIQAAADEYGGGVAGELQAKAILPQLYERREQLDAAIARCEAFLANRPGN